MSHINDVELRVPSQNAVGGENVFVHAGAFIDPTVTIDGFTQIWSGMIVSSGVTIGPGVVFLKSETKTSNTRILENVKIGGGAIIGADITLGQGAVIEAGSLVLQSIPANAIVGGNPARILGYTATVGPDIESSVMPQLKAGQKITSVGVGNVTLHKFKLVKDVRGDLSVGEFSREIPFDPKRYFLVFNVPSEKTRGEHAHHKCHQFLICVKGSCAVVVDDGKSRCEVLLDSPDTGIYLPPKTWGIQYKYSIDAVLLVFTSDYYEAEDYIRDYDEFLSIIAN
jgi:dTDP-4-dehydrorhamnose 3,5-epimerase-like enzyme